MAVNFEELGLDPDVEASNGSKFTLIPPGWQRAVIVKDCLKSNKKKTGMIWKIRLQIDVGQYAGETVDDNINIKNKSAECQAIGQGTLRKICEIHGVAYPPKDTAPLLGLPMGIKLSVGEFTSNNTGKKIKSNNVDAYCALADIPTNTVEHSGSESPASSTTSDDDGWD